MEQKRLFEPLQPTQATIRLDEIELWSNDGARSPLRGSITALGMVDPVTVQALSAGQPYKYRVRAGKRRLTTCRDLSIESVPAVVLPAEMGDIEASLVPLAENILRRENPLHEAKEIRSVFEACRTAGMPHADIKPYLTGMGFPAAVIDARLKLLTLPPDIQHAVAAGKVKPSVAAKIANRSLHEQQQISEVLADKGKLTAQDVSAVRRATVQMRLERLPDALFELPDNHPACRARKMLEALVAEGFSKPQLLALVQNLPEPDLSFIGAKAA